MVANGTMGLLDRRVMTRDPWAMDHGPARQMAPSDLLLCSGKSVVAWKAWYGRKWRNGALLQGQLFKKRRVAHGKEYVLPDRRQHRFHSEVPPREKQAP